MNNFKTFVLLMLSGLVATSAQADIYEWTDEDGVRHYSNHAPAANARVLMKTTEVPYDEAADRARLEAERQERLERARVELARLELARLEAELELREAEAERKLAAAERLAEEARREAENLLEEAAANSRIIYRSGGYWCPDYRYDCYYPIHRRWYYHKKHSRLSGPDISRLRPKPHYPEIKKQYKTSKLNSRHKYRGKYRLRYDGKKASSKLNQRAAIHYRDSGLGVPGARLNKRAHSGWTSSGFGRRY